MTADHRSAALRTIHETTRAQRVRTRVRRTSRTGLVLFSALCLSPEIGLAEDMVWERLSDWIAVSVWKPGEPCPSVPAMLAIDIDPEQARFSVHYYAQEGLSFPLTIGDWQKRTGHDVLVNAGLYRENFTYLGLLYKDGHSLGGQRHAIWKALFVAEPSSSGLKKARILDLASEDFDEQKPPYRQVAQALMLVDHTGKIRVRQTGKRAYQTVIAEARDGHIVIFKSLDLVTLYDLGVCLRDTQPSVDQVMAMDGGSSSDLFVNESLWAKDRQTRDHVSWKALFGRSGATHIPLPTIIGISPQ